jgi:hypothetical protein
VSSLSSDDALLANKSAIVGLIDAPRVRRPPFFFAGEYPVDIESKTRFLEASQKTLPAPARRGDAGDDGEVGASRESATAALVAAGGGASGSGNGGVFPDMVTIFNFCLLQKAFFWRESGKNKEESKNVNGT